jgi:UDP-N-acetyl-D-galactosamine dehydrogenase
MKLQDARIGIIGLGYVGLPLAVEFSGRFYTVGFDISKSRIKELFSGHDSTMEVEDERLKEVVVPHPVSLTKKEGELPEKGLFLTDNFMYLRDCNIFIVTVPTPVDKNNRPELAPLIKASETVGKVISKGGIVIYESTVYPGCTEEDCIPVIEKVSGFKFQVDFFAGYSPERINPGDKEHTVTTIKKVTSGSTPEVAETVDALYRTIIKAGTHKATSIKIAEMAKVIENSQRDINIAFVNEIARICYYMGIDTGDVLEAAATKWNFLKFKPGLVGGHCIGVDPYYLAQKAQEMGYHPEIILAGRRMNDGMASWVAARIVKMMIQEDITVKGSQVLMLGITFKENCPDIRNSKVVDLVHELEQFGCQVDIFDPWASPEEVMEEYGVTSYKSPSQKGRLKCYDAIILAVAHHEFEDFDLSAPAGKKRIVFDLKTFWEKEKVTGRL